VSSAVRPALRELLVSAFLAGLAEIDPADLVERALAPTEGARGRVALLAVGKAALAMARGAGRAWGDRIAAGLVVTVDGAGAGDGEPRGVEVRRAAHPVPDERSVAAAEAALALATALAPADQLRGALRAAREREAAEQQLRARGFCPLLLRPEAAVGEILQDALLDPHLAPDRQALGVERRPAQIRIGGI